MFRLTRATRIDDGVLPMLTIIEVRHAITTILSTVCLTLATVVPGIWALTVAEMSIIEVWAIVTIIDFICGMMMIITGVRVGKRDVSSFGLGLVFLSQMNFYALPLFILLGM